MTLYSEQAHAKINLALHVRHRRDDGYHELDTLFAFVNGGDNLSASLSDELSLRIMGDFAGQLSDGPDNLVLRAAELLRRSYGMTKGAELILEKRLPVASGIGGGSADAAATLRLLNRLWGINAGEVELEKLAAELGADVPACIRSRTCRGRGTGTILSEIPLGRLAGRAILLVNPMIMISTAEIFKKWGGQDGGPLTGMEALDMALSNRNDLQDIALPLHREIGDILRLLENGGADIARMSGSGATCFAIYEGEDLAVVASKKLKQLFPGYWTMLGKFR